MRIVTYVLSFYLLLLTAVPCCVQDDCSADTAISQNTDQQQPEEERSNCSPFFVCGSCTGFTLNEISFHVTVYAQPDDQKFPGWINLYYPSYISAFWQPPRIDG